MNIAELDEFEASINELLNRAKLEQEQKRLEQQRNKQLEEIVQQIKARLEPLLKKVEASLKEFAPDDNSITRIKLQEQADEIKRKLADAPNWAATIADRQLILQEERLLDEQMASQLYNWRQELKADLLEMVSEQNDFFSATDASVAIKGYVNDLKAIGALEELVDALIYQINLHSDEGPVAKLRGSHEQTLNFIYSKAMENRSRVDRAPDVQPNTRHRKSEKRPSLYSDLSGKIVVYGGHDRLETAVRNRLRDSDVEIIWCTEQGGLQLAAQGESHIATADMVIIVTGYASHSLTEKAVDVCKKAGIPYEMVNTTGMTRVLEVIEAGLKTKELARKFGGG
ncbi:MAG: DUF2325 domain-containing protein [Cyanobacteria bacterium M5B4]|nr:MAG: DUF2325 domain-containing protein [Cyanobacteria bacterium M5B4]